MGASAQPQVHRDRMPSAQSAVHVLDSRSKMCCVLWFEVCRHQDATVTDEGAVEASIPWALGCCRCRGWFSSAAYFGFVTAAVCSERRTWVNLQKPVRSATGPRDRESQRCEWFCTALESIVTECRLRSLWCMFWTAGQRCAVCCGLKYVVIRMPLSPMRAL